MSKKVLILSSSLRRGSNSEALADELRRGAECRENQPCREDDKFLQGMSDLSENGKMHHK